MHPVSKIATYAIVIGDLIFGGNYSCNNKSLPEKQDKLREVIISFRHGSKNIQEINHENSDLAMILDHDGGRSDEVLFAKVNPHGRILIVYQHLLAEGKELKYPSMPIDTVKFIPEYWNDLFMGAKSLGDLK